MFATAVLSSQARALPSKLSWNSLALATHWEYAQANDLVIVTKDADFSDRIIVSSPPPRVVHLRFGNMRKNDFHAFLKSVWPQIEQRIQTPELVNGYRNRIESIE